jgi:hypothetical protein
MGANVTTAAEVISTLQSQGIDLLADGDVLRFRPARRITASMLEQLREHKREILSILQDQQHRERSPTTIRCPWCAAISLLESSSGLWCGVCDRLAWQPTQTGGLVRCDVADLEVRECPPTCPTCNQIAFWWDVTGGQHCEHCTPRRERRILPPRPSASTCSPN